MDRRTLLRGLALLSVGAPRLAGAQPSDRVRKLGILSSTSRPGPSDITSVAAVLLPQALREVGYRERENVVIEYRFADGQLDRLPGLARELVAARPEVIVAISHAAVQAALDATQSVAIVMFAVADPVALGWVETLARPGRNVTGIVIEPDTLLVDKRLQLLKELVPRASRIGFLATSEPQVQEQVRGAQRAASGMGFTLVVGVAEDGHYDRAFARIAADRAHALMVPASALLNLDRKRIIALAARHRLPAMYQWREAVDEGGLIAYGSSITELARRTAAYVDKILRGASPANLPVEQPTTYELAINQATARALGLTIPPSMLVRASHVVER